MTPFEAAHGMPFRSPAAAFTEVPVPSAQPPSKTQLRVLQESATAFYKEAVANDKWHREYRAARLNAVGKRRDFNVGDLVKLYMPPTAKEAKRRNRKSRHLCHMRGPMKVITKISNTGYVVQDESGKQYQRTLLNLAPWITQPGDELFGANAAAEQPRNDSDDNERPSACPTSEIAPPSTSAFAVGEFIAVRMREKGRDHFEIHQVTQVLHDELSTRIWGTFQHSITKSYFRPLYFNQKDEKCVYAPSGIKKADSAFTDTLFAATLPRDVLARGLRMLSFTKGGSKLDSKSRNVLENLGGSTILLSLDNNNIQT